MKLSGIPFGVTSDGPARDDERRAGETFCGGCHSLSGRGARLFLFTRGCLHYEDGNHGPKIERISSSST
jgi:hypothetical protein